MSSKKKRLEFTNKTKLIAFQEHKGRCAYCESKLGGNKDPTEYDHKYECWQYEEFGWDIKDLNSVENCLPAHKSCHSFKSNKSTGERAKGRRQAKEFNGDVATKRGIGGDPPMRQKMQNRGFDKKPDGYKYKWS